MENLDIKCAEFGQELADIDGVKEKLLTDVLGVLEEQGLYAAFLFLKTQDGNGGKVCKKANDFLKRTPKGDPLANGNGEILDSVKQLSEELDILLLARDLMRQALVYARYHIKAR